MNVFNTLAHVALPEEIPVFVRIAAGLSVIFQEDNPNFSKQKFFTALNFESKFCQNSTQDSAKILPENSTSEKEDSAKISIFKISTEENRFYHCGICDYYHREKWDGDCREDAARFDLEKIEQRYRSAWEEVGTTLQEIAGFLFE